MDLAGAPLLNSISEDTALSTAVILSLWWCFKQQLCHLKRGTGQSGDGGSADGGGQAVHMRLCLDTDQGFKTKQ